MRHSIRRWVCAACISGLYLVLSAGCAPETAATPTPTYIPLPPTNTPTVTAEAPVFFFSPTSLPAVTAAAVLPTGTRPPPSPVPATLAPLPPLPQLPTATSVPQPTATPAAFSFGHTGSGDGEFHNPTGIAISGDAVYVADSSNNRIQRFTLGGKFVWQSQAGHLSAPGGLAIFNKQVYAADTNGQRVSVFNAETGSFVRSFGDAGTDYNQLRSPIGIAVDSGGTVFVSDRSNIRVQVYQPNGDALRMSGSGGGKPDQFGGGGPIGLAVDANSALYASDVSGARIMVFDATGKFSNYFGANGTEPGKLSLPYGIALDNLGQIVVVEKGNRRVQVFAPDGRFIEARTGGDLSDPSFVAVDASGAFYVTDSKTDRVVVLK